MKKLQKLKLTVAQHKEELKTKYKVNEIGFFLGSYARDEQTKKSDVDILVTFYETIDLFTFVELENYLSDILGVKVDLVMKEGIKPRLKQKILNEAVYL